LFGKKAVQWLNEVLYFVSSFVVSDGLVLRNRQLLIAANHLGRQIHSRKRHCESKGNFEKIK
jgi:hypothetical protein